MTAFAIPNTFTPADVAERFRVIVESVISAIDALTVRSTSASFGTITGLVKRAPNSATFALPPAKSLTYFPTSAMVNIPCAITLGRPTESANSSF